MLAAVDTKNGILNGLEVCKYSSKLDFTLENPLLSKDCGDIFGRNYYGYWNHIELICK